MTTNIRRRGSAARWLATAVGLAAGAYAAHVFTTWHRYGRAKPGTGDDSDALLDQFMPSFDVVERHHIRVDAPAHLTFAVAQELKVGQLLIVRIIMKGRELLLGARPDNRPRPQSLLPQMLSLGWGVLSALPDHEVVVGAVTRPWEPNVTFRAVPAAKFAEFCEPDYVKIAWTLRADPISSSESIFRSETRAVATDLTARRKFRRYWSFLSPGITAIRWALLWPVKREAERRFRETRLQRVRM